MTNRATLEALLARVLEGTGPDRELDGDLAEALQVGGSPWKHEGDGWISVHGFGCQAAMFTASLNAAITLVPFGATWVRRTPSTMALVFGGDDYRMAEVHIEPCRALVASCIRAMMEAQGD